MYVCRRAVLDLLQEKTHFVSLREEFFPWLCKLQYSRSRRLKHAKSKRHLISRSAPSLIEIIAGLQGIYEATSKSLSLQHSSLLDKNPLEEEDDDDVASQTDDPGFHTSLRVGVIIYKNTEEPVTRINTLHKFQEVNRRVCANISCLD